MALGGVLALAPVAAARLTDQPPVATALPAAAPRSPVGPLEMLRQTLDLSDAQAKELEPVLKE